MSNSKIQASGSFFYEASYLLKKYAWREHWDSGPMLGLVFELVQMPTWESSEYMC